MAELHDHQDEDDPANDLPSTTRLVHDPMADHAHSYLSAALVIGGTLFAAWYLGIGLDFDVNAPDFNPFVIFIAVGLLAGVGIAVKSWQARSQMSRFGLTHAEVPYFGIERGQPFVGRIIASRPIEATGDFRIALEHIEMFEHKGRSRYEEPTESVFWRDEISLPPGRHRPEAGLPFRFEIPVQLERMVDPSTEPYARALVSVGLTGYKKRVQAHNRKPDRTRWELSVSAPTRDGTYRAVFVVPQSLHHAGLDEHTGD